MFYRTLTAFIDRYLRRVPSSRATAVLPIVVPLVTLTLIGTFTYVLLEGWTPLDALYATIITMTTVGYGDLTPTTPAGRLFSIFFTLGAIGLASYAISSLAASVIEKQTAKTARRIRRRRMRQIGELRNHIIVCGGTVVGHRVGSELLRRGRPFVLIEADESRLRHAFNWMNPEYIARLRRQFSKMERATFDDIDSRSLSDLAADIGVLYVLDDPTNENVLLQVGIGRASGIITAMDDDSDNIAIILSARDIVSKLDNERLRIISRVSDENNIRRVYLAGADKITAPNMVGGLQMVDHMVNPAVGELWDQMLYNAEQNMRFSEWRLAQHPEWIGRTVGELRRKLSVLTLTIHRNNGYVNAPSSEEVLAADDVLITLRAD